VTKITSSTVAVMVQADPKRLKLLKAPILNAFRKETEPGVCAAVAVAWYVYDARFFFREANVWRNWSCAFLGQQTIGESCFTHIDVKLWRFWIKSSVPVANRNWRFAQPAPVCATGQMRAVLPGGRGHYKSQHAELLRGLRFAAQVSNSPCVCAFSTEPILSSCGACVSNITFAIYRKMHMRSFAGQASFEAYLHGSLSILCIMCRWHAF
jgi:hypothetical protein